MGAEPGSDEKTKGGERDGEIVDDVDFSDPARDLIDTGDADVANEERDDRCDGKLSMSVGKLFDVPIGSMCE